MDVDEAWRHDMPARVDLLSSSACDSADRDNSAAPNCDITLDGNRSGSIHDDAPAYDQIKEFRHPRAFLLESMLQKLCRTVKPKVRGG
jgi:hypothetical protein